MTSRPAVQLENLQACCNQAIAREERFVVTLNIMIDVVIKPLQLKNNAFKREFLQTPAIALCMGLLQDLWTASVLFLGELKLSTTPEKFAKTFEHFSESMHLHQQYVLELSSILYALKLYVTPLSDFLLTIQLPDGLSLESIIILPSNHYTMYRQYIEDYMGLIRENDPCYTTLCGVLEMINAQTDLIDEKLNEAKHGIELLNLQNRFYGNPDIFKVSRRILKEDVLTRVSFGTTGIEYKSFYVHLFNDCFIFSMQKKSMIGSSSGMSYKLHTSIKLSTASISRYSHESIEGLFQIKFENIEIAHKKSSLNLPQMAIFKCKSV